MQQISPHLGELDRRGARVAHPDEIQARRQTEITVRRRNHRPTSSLNAIADDCGSNLAAHRIPHTHVICACRERARAMSDVADPKVSTLATSPLLCKKSELTTELKWTNQAESL